MNLCTRPVEAFYGSIGNGESIESAYKFACVAIKLFNLKEEHVPKLIRRQQTPVRTAPTYEEFSSRTVFLAECSDDLTDEREQVKICLQQRNVEVLPEVHCEFLDADRSARGQSPFLHDVPPNRTVAGVPAKVVGYAGCSEPARIMDQLLPEDERTVPQGE